jgi:citrate lyase subunit beta/citryl-CoA lyase
MQHSYLYVPGDRADLMAKATAGAAHALILDLEDGVAPAAAAAARAAVGDFLAAGDAPAPGRGLCVRVHPAHLDDHLALAVDNAGVTVVLPKAELESLERCARILDRLEASAAGRRSTDVVALVESPQGLIDAAEIAAHDRVVGLALGEADLFAALGVDPALPEEQRHSLRLPVVVASAAAGLRGPTAPVSTDFRDLDAFRASCQGLRSLGFAARSAIHPAQVPVINEVFAPSPEELAEARRMVAAFDAAVAEGRGVIVDERGRMVDEAVVRSARRLLG